MNIATMLRDVLTALVHRPVTQNYPFERQPPPARLRGMIVFDPEECIGCGLCTRDCPSDAIELFVIDRKAKRFVLHYRVDRCLFCAQCVTSCPHSGLSMSHDLWELAALCKDPFDVYYGPEADVKAVVTGTAEPDNEAC
jgi:formate hydrogenlyase subunit 6/NADH:ubiquinone oxidoreductase subunit I